MWLSCQKLNAVVTHSHLASVVRFQVSSVGLASGFGSCGGNCLVWGATGNFLEETTSLVSQMGGGLLLARHQQQGLASRDQGMALQMLHHLR
jgi:hypothetical protein